MSRVHCASAGEYHPHVLEGLEDVLWDSPIRRDWVGKVDDLEYTASRMRFIYEDELL